MNVQIRRSTLILPVNIPRFVEKAYLRGADAIMLDLEDAVPLREKENARKQVKNALLLAGRGGAEVFVRVNKDPALLPEDLMASVYPGLDGITLPKTESAEEVQDLEAQVAKLEREHGFNPGQNELALLIETPRGLLNLEKIGGSSGRVKSISLGPEDYCLELGVEPSREGTELYYALSKLVTICKANGIMPMGLLGSIGGFRDLEGFERAASRARQIGCEGASCIHPDQVEVLNRIIGEWIRKKTLKEVLEECESAEVTIGPIYNMRDIANDAHVKERGSIIESYDPASGKPFPLPQVPIRLLQTPGEIRFPGLPMGAANEVVYQDLLGFSSEEIGEMRAKGVI